jgi:hypothetical protein
MGFEEQFEKAQLEIKHRKMYYSVKRAMNIQVRSKIKPSSMNPVLLNSPMEGGIRIMDQPLDLYYPYSTK